MIRGLRRRPVSDEARAGTKGGAPARTLYDARNTWMEGRKRHGNIVFE